MEVGYAVDPDFLDAVGMAIAALDPARPGRGGSGGQRRARQHQPWNLASERLAARYGFVQVGEHWTRRTARLVYERAARPIVGSPSQ